MSEIVSEFMLRNSPALLKLNSCCPEDGCGPLKNVSISTPDVRNPEKKNLHTVEIDSPFVLSTTEKINNKKWKLVL